MKLIFEKFKFIWFQNTLAHDLCTCFIILLALLGKQTFRMGEGGAAANRLTSERELQSCEIKAASVKWVMHLVRDSLKHGCVMETPGCGGMACWGRERRMLGGVWWKGETSGVPGAWRIWYAKVGWFISCFSPLLIWPKLSSLELFKLSDVLSWVLALSLHRGAVFGAGSFGAVLAHVQSHRRHMPLFSLFRSPPPACLQSRILLVFSCTCLILRSSSPSARTLTHVLLFLWSFIIPSHLAQNTSWRHLYSISCRNKTHSLGIPLAKSGGCFCATASFGSCSAL